MTLGFKHAMGAFRILNRRTRAVARPGLSIWAHDGECALVAVSRSVRSAAYANECDERSLADELSAMLADGKIDANEHKQLARLPLRLTRCAERSQQIAEALKL